MQRKHIRPLTEKEEHIWDTSSALIAEMAHGPFCHLFTANMPDKKKENALCCRVLADGAPFAFCTLTRLLPGGSDAYPTGRMLTELGSAQTSSQANACPAGVDVTLCDEWARMRAL